MIFKNKKYDFKRGKWYIATVIGCFMPEIGIVWNIVNAIIEFKKHKERNTAILFSATGSFIFSVFMTFLIGIVSGMSGQTGSGLFYIMVLLYLPALLMSLFLFAVYYFHLKRSKWLPRIFSIIKNDHITSISFINEIFGIGEKRIIKYINFLVKLGDLDGAYIDKNEKEVMFTISIWAHQLVSCQNCGAELVVNFGHTLICDYCGSALRVKRRNSNR